MDSEPAIWWWEGCPSVRVRITCPLWPGQCQEGWKWPSQDVGWQVVVNQRGHSHLPVGTTPAAVGLQSLPWSWLQVALARVFDVEGALLWALSSLLLLGSHPNPYIPGTSSWLSQLTWLCTCSLYPSGPHLWPGWLLPAPTPGLHPQLCPCGSCCPSMSSSAVYQ